MPYIDHVVINTTRGVRDRLRALIGEKYGASESAVLDALIKRAETRLDTAQGIPRLLRDGDANAATGREQGSNADQPQGGNPG